MEMHVVGNSSKNMAIALLILYVQKCQWIIFY